MATTTTDRIEKQVLIAAPVDRVWELVTSAEHLGTWFGDAGAEIDLRPGGRLTVRWRSNDTLHGRVETVAAPHHFSYRWLLTDDAAEPTPANSTLVEFSLAADGDGTRLAVVESGFDALGTEAWARAERLASHTEGWPLELAELAAYAAGPAVER
jgi:uncharacterized protein YndB with AHSA1/START domain